MRWPFRRRVIPANPTAAVKLPAVRRIRASTTDEFHRDDDDGKGIFQGTQLGSGEDGDLDPVERQRSVRLSRQEYKQSAAYGGVLDRLLDFVVGDGVTIKAKKSANQKFLDEVLKKDQFHLKLKKRLRKLFVDGEFLWTIRTVARDEAAQTPTDAIRLGRLSPDNIAGVKVDALDHDELKGVVYRRALGDEISYPLAQVETKPLLVAPTEEERKAGMLAQLVAVDLWRVNALGVRGCPLLLRVVDKSSALDSAVENVARKAEYVNRFWLHVTYKKANDESIGENSKDLAFEKKVLDWAASLEPGACLVTGDDVKVNVHAPDLKLIDLKALFDILLDWILGSNGIPRMWFSSGNTIRAEAAEQGTPTFRAIRSLQADTSAGIVSLMKYALYLGQLAGVEGVTPEDEVEAVMADVATRDSERDVREIAGLTVAMGEALAANAIDKEEHQGILRKVITSKGFGDQLKDKPPPIEEEDEEPPVPPGEVPEGPPQDRADDGKNPPTDDGRNSRVRAGLPIHRLQPAGR